MQTERKSAEGGLLMIGGNFGKFRWQGIFSVRYAACTKGSSKAIHTVSSYFYCHPSLLFSIVLKTIYKRVSPNALRTNEHPARMVSAAPTDSRLGLTSTKSMATKLPVSCTHSQMKSPSRSVRPPRTGVPVLGAHCGSSASTSNDRWMGVSWPMWARAFSTTRPIP